MPSSGLCGKKRQTPIDVCDSMTMSVIALLSIQSLKEGNTAIAVSYFTNGKWKERKNRFALDDGGF